MATRRTSSPLERATRVATELGTVERSAEARVGRGPGAWSLDVSSGDPARAWIVAASPTQPVVVVMRVEVELREAGLQGALALVKGFGDAVFEPGCKVEVPSVAYELAMDRKAAAYLIAEPSWFGVTLPAGVRLAVALHDYEIDMEGEALRSEVYARVPDGLSWL